MRHVTRHTKGTSVFILTGLFPLVESWVVHKGGQWLVIWHHLLKQNWKVCQCCAFSVFQNSHNIAYGTIPETLSVQIPLCPQIYSWMQQNKLHAHSDLQHQTIEWVAKNITVMTHRSEHSIAKTNLYQPNSSCCIASASHLQEQQVC